MRASAPQHCLWSNRSNMQASLSVYYSHKGGEEKKKRKVKFLMQGPTFTGKCLLDDLFKVLLVEGNICLTISCGSCEDGLLSRKSTLLMVHLGLIEFHIKQVVRVFSRLAMLRFTDFGEPMLTGPHVRPP